MRRPSRDRRIPYEAIRLVSSIREPKDLPAGKELKTRVTGFSNYGIFVDIGLYAPALLHKSKLPDELQLQYYKQLRIGQIIIAKVNSVDTEKNRVELELVRVEKPRGFVDESVKPPVPPQRERQIDRPRQEFRAASGHRPRHNTGKDHRPNKPQQKKSQFGTLGDQFRTLLGNK